MAKSKRVNVIAALPLSPTVISLGTHSCALGFTQQCEPIVTCCFSANKFSAIALFKRHSPTGVSNAVLLSVPCHCCFSLSNEPANVRPPDTGSPSIFKVSLCCFSVPAASSVN